MTVLAVVQAVQDLVADVTGIRVAPDYAPDALNVFPASVAYPESGVYDLGRPMGDKQGLHTIVVEIHVLSADLPKAIQASIGYIETVTNALMADPTLTGSCQTYGRISYTYGPMAWGTGQNAVATFGPRFVIEDVKIHTAL